MYWQRSYIASTEVDIDKGAIMDFELNNYRDGSEIRAVYDDRPQELVAEFLDYDSALLGWNQIMAVI